MKLRTVVIAGAILLAACTRLMPHPQNFAPMTAIALFGAATLRDRRLALLTPLLALFVSDLCIEVLHRLGVFSSWGIYPQMWVNYAILFAIAGMGFLLRGRRRFLPIAGATLAASLLFFLLSNFAVWAMWDLPEYPHNWAGLVHCYELAIPFFRWSLLGDAIYVTALFGGLAIAESWLPALRDARPTPTAEPIQV